MEVRFLGTGGSIPTGFRASPSVIVRREGELLMFDCGEGTQTRMAACGLGLNNPMRIFITHMHGDHVLGLPGLLMSMSLLGRRRELEIYGPPGIREFLESIGRVLGFDLKFPIGVKEVSGGEVVRGRGYRVLAECAEHGIPCNAFSLEEEARRVFLPERAMELGVPKGPLWKELQLGRAVNVNGRVVEPSQVLGEPKRGKKIVYASDTRPSKPIINLSRGADLLIHDSTFDDSRAKEAEEYGHSTASEAASVAKGAGVGALVLFHLSPMYRDPAPLLLQAKQIFPNSMVAYDSMALEL
ncbi:MAG: ribonuclease Z [Candidatus Bathyarchaeia archaeon]